VPVFGSCQVHVHRYSSFVEDFDASFGGKGSLGVGDEDEGAFLTGAEEGF